VVPLEYFETEAIQILLEIINSPAFKQRVEALGGYNTAKTGSVIL
jgi:putative molybdopterin biosynthesis protein